MLAFLVYFLYLVIWAVGCIVYIYRTYDGEVTFPFVDFLNALFDN